MLVEQNNKSSLIVNGNGKARRAKGHKRRQEIVEKAKEILITEGPASLVLRDVAQQIGITHGNLQYYFPTKHDLLVAIFDQEVTKYTDGLRVAVSATSSRQGRLAAIIDAGVEQLKTPETSLWRMLMSLSDYSDEMASILKKENELYIEALIGELELISPELSPQRRGHVARIIHALLDGLGVQLAYDDLDSPHMKGLINEIKIGLSGILFADKP